ncbi:hypothetical protein BJV77DRAFT_992642 [Russula vinacea]|nr:hypothetical protein BJV77DRAFT_992642 [Russula vinacea]
MRTAGHSPNSQDTINPPHAAPPSFHTPHSHLHSTQHDNMTTLQHYTRTDLQHITPSCC